VVAAAVAAVAILLSSCTRYSYTYVKGSEVEYKQIDSMNISRTRR
jgi:outer membrane protein assembly factor BamE (lipoprotein component of BamABCDE complex)